VTRTERLHAITEEIRRCSPTAVRAADLATLLGVSRRTIERDLSALRDGGLPLLSDVGRGGGHHLHRSAVLPPLNLTSTETTALLVALTITEGMPYTRAAWAAAAKLRRLLPPETAVLTGLLCDRIRVDRPNPPVISARTMHVLEDAVASGTVVRFTYRDRLDATTRRDVEPAGFYATADAWYLAGWCRSRDDRRMFRLDRISRPVATRQPIERRDLDDVLGWLPSPTVTPGVAPGRAPAETGPSDR
jgi:predicted DNA-binding transcriptional regulator YafY